jgi:hypothetical protein
MDNKDEGKLSHLEEYKTLSAEITLYQHEIHRTWLWAIITSGAVYTWLALHRAEINALSKLVLIIPPILLVFCAIRYFSFRRRIEQIKSYFLELEKDAFGQETNENLRGFGHFTKTNRQHLNLKKLDASYYWTFLLWFFLIVCAGYLSYNLSKNCSSERAASGHDFDHHNACCH